MLPAGKAIRLWNTGQELEAVRPRPGIGRALRLSLHHHPSRRSAWRDRASGAAGKSPAPFILSRKCVGLTQTADHVELRFETGATGHGKARGRRRRRAFGGARSLVRRGEAEFLRHHRLARRHPDGARAGLDLAHHRHQLGRPRRPRRALSAARRKTAQLRRHGRARLDRRRLERARHDGRSAASDFRGWHADVHALIRNIDVPYKWGLALRPPMDAWSKGRCTLLGDACHPMVPLLAQGAVMALEDGFVLARASKNIRTITSRVGALTRRRAATAPTRSSPAPPP